MKKHIRNASLVTFSLLALWACGKDKDDEENLAASPPAKTSIASTDTLAAEGCLSIPLYLRQIALLNPQLPMLEVTKDMEFSAKSHMRHNFEVVSSFGAFQFADRNVAALQEEKNIVQAGCDSFVVTDANGTAEEFKVKEKSREMISGVAESGRRLTYRWVSPTQLEIKNRYITYDLPCGSELKPIFAEQTVIYDWSAERPAAIPDGSVHAISRSYLERISEATGKNVSDFYSGDGVQNAEALRGIPSLLPRPELLMCNPGDAPPPPPEEDDGNNDDGTEEGTPPPPPPPPSDGGTGAIYLR